MDKYKPGTKLMYRANGVFTTVICIGEFYKRSQIDNGMYLNNVKQRLIDIQNAGYIFLKRDNFYFYESEYYLDKFYKVVYE